MEVLVWYSLPNMQLKNLKGVTNLTFDEITDENHDVIGFELQWHYELIQDWGVAISTIIKLKCTFKGNQNNMSSIEDISAFLFQQGIEVVKTFNDKLIEQNIQRNIQFTSPSSEQLTAVLKNIEAITKALKQ